MCYIHTHTHPWHISPMLVSVQIIVLCLGRYNQNHDHCNPSLLQNAPARNQPDAKVHVFPIHEWDMSSRLLLLSNDVLPRPCPSGPPDVTLIRTQTP